MTRTGILLAAHGAVDRTANRLVETLAALLGAAGAADEVVAGFQEGDRGFTEAFDLLTADRILVLPLFTSDGYYTEHVLKRAVAAGRRFGEVRVHQAPAIGTEPGLAELVQARIEAVIRTEGLDPDGLSVLLIGHGTRRNPRSRDSSFRLADRLEGAAAEVAVGFLDDDPDIEAAVAALRFADVLVIPFLIGGGGHTTRDLPLRLDAANPGKGRRIVVDLPIGGYPGLRPLLLEVARREMPAAPAMGRVEPGSVALVGAGPGDPGLITVKGLALLRSADVVLHDRLSSPELLTETKRGALIIDVGKTPGGRRIHQECINALLVEHALEGRSVVRLKGGDPFVFGRGSEEVDACREAGVPCTVVPGITSAIAVPAAAGIPVTARGESRSFAVISAQTEVGGGMPAAVSELAANPVIETLVLLMGRGTLAELSAALIAAGRDPETPAACVQSGTTPDQRVVAGTLATIAELADEEGLEAPVVTVIGQVASRALVEVPC